MTRSSSADRRAGAAASPSRLRTLARRSLGAAATGLWAGSLLLAAEGRFQFEAGASELYSQDVLRDGSGRSDEITRLRVDAGMEFLTPRSSTTFGYTPDYLRYASLTGLDTLDHAYHGLWRFHPGRLSEVSLRQGFSRSTRQVGFTDLAQVGGNASEPVISRTRRTAWDLEPRWALAPSPLSNGWLEGTYRSEEFEDASLIDSRQAGIEGGLTRNFGRRQSLGGVLRADRFDFSRGGQTLTSVYDRFAAAQVAWSIHQMEHFTFDATGGLFHGEGAGIAAAMGPTASASGDWRFRRSSVRLSYGLGYSSGGGTATAEKSQYGDAEWRQTWGRGWEASEEASFITRRAFNSTVVSTAVGAGTRIDGQAANLRLTKRWPRGLGLTLSASQVRQVTENGALETRLSYAEAAAGVDWRRPQPRPRPVPEAAPDAAPPPATPPGRSSAG